jgi:protease I
MATVLIVVPQSDFDPTEVAVPWDVWMKAGHDVVFASETGAPASCDQITLTGEGLPVLARSLQAKRENAALYAAMIGSPAFLAPIAWADARAAGYDAIHFPGGHAPGMRPYCESPEVQRIAREAFAADQPVSAICHGVLPLARAGVLQGRKTTALTGMMEGLAITLTRRRLGDHYRTYPISVEAEVKSLLTAPTDFDAGPVFPRYATAAAPDAGFAVNDGNYLSARWPGDAYTLAHRLDLLLKTGR